MHWRTSSTARISDLRAKFGEIGDTRLTVMAALTVADELAEASCRQAPGGGLAALQEARVAAADRAKADAGSVAAML